MRHPAAAVVALAASLALLACRDPARALPDSCTLALPDVSLGLAPGDTTRLSAALQCTGSGPHRVVWSSSAPDVVAVDSVGGVTALTLGSAVVSAQVVGLTGARDTVPFLVTAPPCTLRGISVNPSSLSLSPGTKFTIRASLNTGPGCGSAVDSGLVFTSSDTAAATVDATGTVTGGTAIGHQSIITVTARSNPNVRAFTIVTLTPRLGPFADFQVSPSTLSLAPLDTARIVARLVLTPGTPAGTDTSVTFTTSDSCIARVSPQGLVAAGLGGTTAIITVAPAASPSLSQQVGVTIGMARGPALRIASFAAGPTAAPVDPSALRGTVTATVSLLRPDMPGAGTVELRLAGRLAGTGAFDAATPGTVVSTVALTFDTDARDPAGQRLYPNGQQTIEVRVQGGIGPAFAGCVGPIGGFTGTTLMPVTLVNP